MAQAKARLSAVEIKQAKPDPTGRARILADGGGLRLVIHPNGSKYWQFRTARGGKETTLQLGIYPQTDLAAARQKADALRKQAQDGLDLVLERKLANLQQEAEAAISFQSVAEELLAIKKRNGISGSYYDKIASAFKANLYPSLGNLPINRIQSALLKS